LSFDVKASLATKEKLFIKLKDGAIKDMSQ
jgi:hypothetical protein